ncbi:phosphotransferase enzyme family protein [Clostridium sp.]|uniref:phosphotransferase enzyme family protein n=1 Tax=Clostridium sp. TaxID=1506 RepID=UPI003464C20D
MLKLKYLFDNKYLALMLLENWDYDKTESSYLKFFRISSNAIYIFKNNGENIFLRFTPSEEKSKDSIMAELEFLSYLRNNGYPAVDTLLSKSGKEIEVVDTPWGIYYAVAFKEVPGELLIRLSLTEDIMFGYGKSLGKLHKLCSKYIPSQNKRNDWKDSIKWMEDILSNFPDETSARNELYILKNYFLSLPYTKENFGLIHYDFETDNVFYNEVTNTYHPIDFDDGLYHWYVMDVVQAIESIKDTIEEEHVDSFLEKFISGYSTEYDIPDDMINLFPIFRRYADLYSYVRVIHSLRDKWNNEPKWMVTLRIRLNNFLSKAKNNFGNPI